MTILLYACVLWTLYKRHERRLNHIQLSCLRKLLKISWQDKLPDTDVVCLANTHSIYTQVRKAQIKLADHVHWNQTTASQSNFYIENLSMADVW